RRGVGTGPRGAPGRLRPAGGAGPARPGRGPGGPRRAAHPAPAPQRSPLGRAGGGAPRGRARPGRRPRPPRLRSTRPRPTRRGEPLMLLGIDTSGAVSTAVARGDLTGPAPEILQVRSDARSRHHDEVLLALIDETLQAAGAERRDLTGVAVGRGPGPFTGLGVGLVSARSIAAVLGVPLHGLSSLDALAHQALAALEPAAEGPVTVGVALDARRREVYHARYRREASGEILRIAEPAVGTPADVAESLTACDLLVGSGTAMYAEQLPAPCELAAEGAVTVGVAPDARRREVYHARHRGAASGEILRIAEPAVGSPADVAESLTACDLLVGSGTAMYPEQLPATAQLVHVDAGHLILAAAALAARGEDLSSTEPMYLREPDAAKPTARKSALGR